MGMWSSGFTVGFTLSLMRVSDRGGGWRSGTAETASGGCQPPGMPHRGVDTPRSPDWSALVDRQHGVVELHDGEVAGGDEHRADVAAAPGAVGGLGADEVVEGVLAVLGP